ncbi:helix-turn-helix transcriptional regulator [Lipingzhangella sp. LS1_29]|uniref:Helix-turn-helix transcriptional regulator n=1 Tax=Lipingzhangella rawalii TaxID=2055835 RepID=A0ABU2H4G0_9ACTN|nr:helix-turn-helix transcriptional regulator [Lipingzhangella rawalii]MDS1270181.1 helix-turn-helix transcriptional regulator [Lipingzhangella rawalii]
MGHQQAEANVRFGREVSRLRRLSGFTQQRLAREVTGLSSSHLSNLELGRRSPNLRLVADLDQALHAEGRLQELWRKLTDDGEPAWLDDLANLEREATSIMESHIEVFPSLLQTEGYARSVARAVSPWATEDEISAMVTTRMERAQRFTEAAAPTYRAVLDGSIIRRHWGSNQVMAKQLRHVIHLVERGRISVQVADPTSGHPGLVGTFKLISSPVAPEVTYVESAHSGHLIDDPEQVQRFRILFADIQAAALSPRQSLPVLRDELEGMDHD